jgi:RNA polymerase sigma factor (sigma-70 family)
MNRVLGLLRECLARSEGDADRHLLDRFLAARDESAFAELVRRYGRVVWGVCQRRLANHHDAEDAFQATFLVLIRRAARLGRDIPLGPWLHRVAVMTARNVQRGNRRRATVSGPMEHELPSAKVEPVAERLDIDAALLALPERYRVPVVLCHLQGLSRREAAAVLGCPEGTLSSLLSRALVRLRARLGGAVAGVLVGTTIIPTDLYAATVRCGMIFSTSTLTAAGVSPAVAGLTSGVLRMFWMKKAIAGLAMAVLVAGGLLAGFTLRTDGVAHATAPLAVEPAAPPDDPDARAKKIEKQIEDVRKQRELLGALEMDLFAEKEKLEEAKKAKAAADAAAELGKDIAISVGNGNPSGYTYTVREVVNGKVAEIHTSDIDILRTYLTRAFNDPKGPKALRVSAFKDHPADDLRGVFAACAAAGYAKATFSHAQRPPVVSHDYVKRMIALEGDTVDLPVIVRSRLIESPPAPGEIDLTKYAPKKPR